MKETGSDPKFCCRSEACWLDLNESWRQKNLEPSGADLTFKLLHAVSSSLRPSDSSSTSSIQIVIHTSVFDLLLMDQNLSSLIQKIMRGLNRNSWRTGDCSRREMKEPSAVVGPQNWLTSFSISVSLNVNIRSLRWCFFLKPCLFSSDQVANKRWHVLQTVCVPELFIKTFSSS